MVRVYIANPRGYFNMVRGDKTLVDFYADYDDDDLRGLISVTVRGFNSMRHLSQKDRGLNLRYADPEKDTLYVASELVKVGLRRLLGRQTTASCVFGKPEKIERVTRPLEGCSVEIPVNGYPFLDHENAEVATYIKRQRLSRGVFCFDLEGNVIGAREIELPQTFGLNGVGKEILSVKGTPTQQDRQAVFASENGLSSVTLSEDGSVMGFFGGYTIRDLTYISPKER